jgi:hypothetical protein
LQELLQRLPTTIPFAELALHRHQFTSPSRSERCDILTGFTLRFIYSEPRQQQSQKPVCFSLPIIA